MTQHSFIVLVDLATCFFFFTTFTSRRVPHGHFLGILICTGLSQTWYHCLVEPSGQKPTTRQQLLNCFGQKWLKIHPLCHSWRDRFWMRLRAKRSPAKEGSYSRPYSCDYRSLSKTARHACMMFLVFLHYKTRKINYRPLTHWANTSN